MQLLSGEEIVWHGRPSWRSMLAFYIKWGVLALVPGVLGQIVASASSADKYRWDLWLVTVVLLLVVLFCGWLKRVGTHYTVTNQRINIREGILSRSDHATGYERLQNVKTYQSLLERMLKVGLVDFDTAAGSDFDFKFRGVEDPESLARQISELQRNATQGQPSQPHHGV